jgi:hypothetical protein
MTGVASAQISTRDEFSSVYRNGSPGSEKAQAKYSHAIAALAIPY